VTCLRARSGHRRKLCLNPCRNTDRGLSRKPAQSHGGYNETHNFICLPFSNAGTRTDRRCTRAGHAPDHRCPAGCSGRTKQPTTKLKQPGPHWPRTTDPAGCSSNQLTSLGGPSVCRASPSALTGLRLRCEGVTSTRSHARCAYGALLPSTEKSLPATPLESDRF